MPRGHPFASRLPVRRVERSRYAALPDPPVWPLTIPAVRALLGEGLDLGDCTILVGPNGSGKSTVVEAIALAFGLSPEGGSTGARHTTRASESPLADWLTLVRNPGASRWGYFLRAETMHGLFTYLEDHPGNGPEPVFHEVSHGESFVAMLGTSRFGGDGFFVLDEPEAGLSFEAQLHLVSVVHAISRRPGAQVVLATHSPVLTAVPGATVVQLGDHGLRETTWGDLDVVINYRLFLADPGRYLRHVLQD